MLLLHQANAKLDFDELTMDVLGRLQSVYYAMTENEMSVCQQNAQACFSCVKTCQYQPGSIKEKAHEARLRQANMVKEVATCHAEYLKLRTGLPDWCFNRGTEFYTTPDFEPTSEICGLMSKRRCAQQWVDDLEIDIQVGKLKKNSHEHKTGKKALEYANLLEAIDLETRELERIPELAEQYSEEKKQNLLEQAMRHLQDPSKNSTIYSNPVYADLDTVKAENNKWDREISKNDAYMAGIENMFVRKSTIDRIPEILNSILKLENHVHSKRAETDTDLNAIKSLSKKTAKLQSQTTNLLFESTHVKNADGTIEALDDELISLYEKLREKRTSLRKLNEKGTGAKAQLLDIMRQLVQEISKQQDRMGCRAADVVFQ